MINRIMKRFGYIREADLPKQVTEQKEVQIQSAKELCVLGNKMYDCFTRQKKTWFEDKFVFEPYSRSGVLYYLAFVLDDVTDFVELMDGIGNPYAIHHLTGFGVTTTIVCTVCRDDVAMMLKLKYYRGE